MAELAQVLPVEQDEAAFLAELQSGSESAFDRLITQYHALVFNLVYGMLGNSADAADATQEVFLKAFRAIRGFRRSSSLKTWLYHIAIRQALNQRRWWWRHLRRQMSLDEERDDGRPVLELSSYDPSPFDSAVSSECQRVVREALARVAEPFRSAVLLRDLEGLSYEEVAEVLGVSVGTVKSRILRGRRALRELLEPLVIPRRAAEADGSDMRVEVGLAEPLPGAAFEERFRISPARGGGR